MSIVLYFFVGGISFIVNFAVFLMFVHLMGLHWIAANIAGFLVAAMVNYILSVSFVFESRLFSQRRLEVFLTLVVSAIGVALETLLIYFGYDVANLNLNVAKLGAAGIVFFWNYGTRRFFVFGAVKGFDWPVLTKGRNGRT
jgi:putative flippase GtrA